MKKSMEELSSAKQSKGDSANWLSFLLCFSKNGMYKVLLEC